MSANNPPAVPAPARPRILMCPPDYFEPAPPHPRYGFANAYEEAGRKLFDRNPAGFRRKAAEQWLALHETFSRFADIVLLEPQDGKPDMVYTADASFSLVTRKIGRNPARAVTLLARFTNAARDEASSHRAKIAEADPGRIFIQSQYPFEGGDMVYDPYRDILWGGYHHDPLPDTVAEGRTHRMAHTLLPKTLGNIPVISLRTCRPAYHLNTIIGALPRGELIVNKAVLADTDLGILLRRGFKNFRNKSDLALRPEEYLLAVPPQDIASLAPNIRCFGNTVVMPACSVEMQDMVKRRGYDLVMLDLSCFIAGGGAVHTLANTIDKPRVVMGHAHRGTAPEPNF